MIVCSSPPTHASPVRDGYFIGQYFHNPFPSPILRQFGRNISILELLTIMVTLKLWSERLRGKRVILKCDNEKSVLAIHSGCSRIPGMHLCLGEIWFLTARYDIDIFARHVAVVDNSIADHLSRWHFISSSSRALCLLDSRHAHRTRSMFTSFVSIQD